MSAAMPPPLVPATPTLDRSALGIPHPRPFVCALNVEQNQLSTMIPHVSNIEYVRWLDRAAELHADALGYTRLWMLRAERMWFVARHEVDYLAEAWAGDRLLIVTWVRDMRRVKSWRDYVIVRPADDVVICRAATLWVYVNLETRRPTRIDPEMSSRFEPCDQLAPESICQPSCM